jgi:hypothetical protein
VLDDVQPVALLLGLDPQPVRGLDHEEDEEADEEHCAEGGGHAQPLDAELLEGAGVKEPAFADRVELCEPR